MTVDPHPIGWIENGFPRYTLINSIDFHPQELLFCASFTQANRIVFYRIDDKGKIVLVQTLSNPKACLSEPQHAVFSPDGSAVAVANWTNQTILIFRRTKRGFYSSKPDLVIPAPPRLLSHKPHGIVFSPCGRFLAIAYGAAYYHPRAIAVFKMENGCELIDLLETPHIPKGIAYSPDGTALLVTFSDANRMEIYDLGKERIFPMPRQIIEGSFDRPEDVKLSRDGNFCAVSNSSQNTVSFYRYDQQKNRIEPETPIALLENLTFPHGLAFSADGAYLSVTEFGRVNSSLEGDIVWDLNTPAKEAKIKVFSLGKKLY